MLEPRPRLASALLYLRYAAAAAAASSSTALPAGLGLARGVVPTSSCGREVGFRFGDVARRARLCVVDRCFARVLVDFLLTVAPISRLARMPTELLRSIVAELRTWIVGRGRARTRGWALRRDEALRGRAEEYGNSMVPQRSWGTLKKDLERTSNVNRQSRGQCSSLRDWIGSLFTMFGDRARTTGYDCGRPGG